MHNIYNILNNNDEWNKRINNINIFNSTWSIHYKKRIQKKHFNVKFNYTHHPFLLIHSNLINVENGKKVIFRNT